MSMIKEQLFSVFPHCETFGCLSFHAEKVLYICDDESHRTSYLIESQEAAHFTVENPSGKELGFLRIDECLISGNETQKCDFSLFDTNVWLFVDSKDVEKKMRNKAKKDATNQLKRTIEICIERGIDFSAIYVIAIIGLTFIREYPASTTSLQTAIKLFDDLALTSGIQVEVLEGNMYRF